jgi:hypothetical protein
MNLKTRDHVPEIDLKEFTGHKNKSLSHLFGEVKVDLKPLRLSDSLGNLSDSYKSLHIDITKKKLNFGQLDHLFTDKNLFGYERDFYGKKHLNPEKNQKMAQDIINGGNVQVVPDNIMMDIKTSAPEEIKLRGKTMKDEFERIDIKNTIEEQRPLFEPGYVPKDSRESLEMFRSKVREHLRAESKDRTRNMHREKGFKEGDYELANNRNFAIDEMRLAVDEMREHKTSHSKNLEDVLGEIGKKQHSNSLKDVLGEIGKSPAERKKAVKIPTAPVKTFSAPKTPSKPSTKVNSGEGVETPVPIRKPGAGGGPEEEEEVIDEPNDQSPSKEDIKYFEQNIRDVLRKYVLHKELGDTESTRFKEAESIITGYMSKGKIYKNLVLEELPSIDKEVMKHIQDNEERIIKKRLVKTEKAKVIQKAVRNNLIPRIRAKAEAKAAGGAAAEAEAKAEAEAEPKEEEEEAKPKAKENKHEINFKSDDERGRFVGEFNNCVDYFLSQIRGDKIGKSDTFIRVSGSSNDTKENNKRGTEWGSNVRKIQALAVRAGYVNDRTDIKLQGIVKKINIIANANGLPSILKPVGGGSFEKVPFGGAGGGNA